MKFKTVKVFKCIAQHPLTKKKMRRIIVNIYILPFISRCCMLLKALKSCKDRFSIALEATDPSSLVREMDTNGIPFDFWATNFAYATPGIQWTVSVALERFLY